MSVVTPLRVDPEEKKVLELIAEALRSIQFGAVEIILHNGQVVQIERKEKIRL